MEARQSSTFDPEAPHFFKIMLDEDIKTGKLIIPKKFARKYGTRLSESDVVILRVPTGDTWNVELIAIDGVVQLEKGWPEFLNFYSVQHGDFLVLRYESGSSNELDVVLLDKTCTEVEYPKKLRVNASPIKVEDIDEDDDIAEETRERQPSRRTTRTEVQLRTRKYPSRKNDVRSKDPSSSAKKTRGALRRSEKAEALDRAKSFESSRPYFLLVMQPYYVHPRYNLNMPGRFLQRYISQKGRGEMQLHVSGSKIWSAEYIFRGEGRRTEAKARRGWRAFVKDNDLVVGDVCVFELIKGLPRIAFKITIFRAPRPTS